MKKLILSNLIKVKYLGIIKYKRHIQSQQKKQKWSQG